MKYENQEISEDQVKYLILDRRELIQSLTNAILVNAKLNKKIELYEYIIGLLLAAVIALMVF